MATQSLILLVPYILKTTFHVFEAEFIARLPFLQHFKKALFL